MMWIEFCFSVLAKHRWLLGALWTVVVPGFVQAQPEPFYSEFVREQKLPDYYIDSPKPDTVSVAEMRAAFERAAGSVPVAGSETYEWLKPYNELQAGVVVASGPYGRRLDASRPVWHCHTWQLYRSVEGADSSVTDSLSALYGRDTYGIPARWLSGQVAILGDPMPYMGFLVSGALARYQLEKGRLWLVEEQVRRSRFVCMADSLFQLPGLEWVQGRPVETVVLVDADLSQRWRVCGSVTDMDVLGRFVNASFGRSRIKKGVCETFQLLLVTGGDGRTRLEWLTARETTPLRRKLEQRLQEVFRSLPRHAFCPLWNVDGRVFPGRYVEAVCTDKGWRFREYGC